MVVVSLGFSNESASNDKAGGGTIGTDIVPKTSPDYCTDVVN